MFGNKFNQRRAREVHCKLQNVIERTDEALNNGKTDCIHGLEDFLLLG